MDGLLVPSINQCNLLELRKLLPLQHLQARKDIYAIYHEGIFKVIENLALVPGFEVGWLFIPLFFPWGVVFPSFKGWETHGLVFNYVIHLQLSGVKWP